MDDTQPGPKRDASSVSVEGSRWRSRSAKTRRVAHVTTLSRTRMISVLRAWTAIALEARQERDTRLASSFTTRRLGGLDGPHGHVRMHRSDGGKRRSVRTPKMAGRADQCAAESMTAPCLLPIASDEP